MVLALEAGGPLIAQAFTVTGLSYAELENKIKENMKFDIFLLLCYNIAG